jgi:carotenoid 1,2-hydratase
VFSPYYAFARGRGPARALDFCAINVALYGAAGKRWAMTERGSAAVRRSPHRLQVGPSSIGWEADTLVVRFAEVGVPVPRRLSGTVRLTPSALFRDIHALEATGRHRWWPVAPCASVEVELDRPRLRWAGHGYHDTNWGHEPLERGFSGWHWSRSWLPDGSTAVLYDTEPRGQQPTALALRFDPSGHCAPIDAPPQQPLPQTLWRVRRLARSEAASAPLLLETLEDAPFYARSLLTTQLGGAPAQTFHESLSLDRFSRGWVRMLLPFRMPRRAG